MARKPLASGSDYDSIGVKKDKKSTSASGSQDKIKVALAGSLVLVAALILAWHFGFFDRGIPAGYEPPTAEEIQHIEEIEREIELQIERGEIPAPASS